MFPKSAAANRGHNLSWKAGAVKISDAVLCLMTPAVNNAPSPSLLKSDRICFAIDFSAKTSLVVYHHPENTLACFCSPLLAVTWQNITKGLGGGNGQKSLILPNLRLWFSISASFSHHLLLCLCDQSTEPNAQFCGHCCKETELDWLLWARRCGCCASLSAPIGHWAEHSVFIFCTFQHAAGLDSAEPAHFLCRMKWGGGEESVIAKGQF